MELLQAGADVVNGMDDVHFNMKDVIYIVTLVISVLGGWFSMKAAVEKLKHRLENVDKHIDTCQADAKEENVAAKHSRTGIRKQFQEEMKTQREFMNKRIDIVKQDLKEHNQSNETAFKTLNDQMTAVKTDTALIKGMVETLVSKNNN
jgi:chaperonin cofactor prefoldin